MADLLHASDTLSFRSAIEDVYFRAFGEPVT